MDMFRSLLLMNYKWEFGFQIEQDLYFRLLPKQTGKFWLKKEDQAMTDFARLSFCFLWFRFWFPNLVD